MNEREIFTAASLIEDSELRNRFLSTVCQDDTALRDRIESLLRAGQHAEEIIQPSQRALQQLAGESVLQSDLNQLNHDLDRSDSHKEVSKPGILPPGSRIGDYQIQQFLGEGGMGVVYVAKQLEPIRRQVALKILRPNSTSANVLARFEQERHALAMMEHPGIARILDAGSTQDGIPYFVMELVKGVPINQYCDQENLSPQERLQLFIPVCQAVQHAHQKGIIHRDLKPSNILIGLYDGKPIPKVIDFGVAKAIGARLADTSVYTEVGSVVGTLEYMAPEQAELNNLDIDTRADIYSLGVVLYELLTGSPPFSRQQLQSAAFDEMLRMIREVDPPKPSTKVSSSEQVASVAAHRKLEPKQLAKALSGDLDWVVMKSLSKERTRRYQTVIEFANDIDRFLKVQPVTAGPPGLTYRTRRFFKRNKVLSIAAFIASTAMLVGGASAVWGYIESNQQYRLATAAEANERAARELAEARLKQVEKGIEVLSSIFDKLNPGSVSGSSGNLREELVSQLNSAAQSIQEDLLGEPLSIARLQYRMGLALLSLGSPTKALEIIQSAEKKFQESRAGDSEILNCREVAATCLTRLGRSQEALESLRVLLEDKKRHLGETHLDTIATINNLGTIYSDLGEYESAAQQFQQSLEICARQYGSDAPVTLTSAHNLATIQLKMGDNKSAVLEMERILRERRRVLGREHQDTLNSMESLAFALRRSGKLKEALSLLDEVAEISRQTLGNDHPQTDKAISNQAMLLQDLGETAKSVPLLEQVERYRQSKFGPDHPDTLAAMANLAVAYRQTDRINEAMPLYIESYEKRRKLLGSEHPDTLTSMNNLGSIYLKQEEFDKAIPLLEECLSIRTQIHGEDHQLVGVTMLNLARAYQESEQLDKAELLFRKTLAQREKTLAADHPNILTGMVSLAVTLRRLKKYDECIQLIESVLERGRNRADGLPRDVQLLPEMLAQVYSEAGRLEEAERESKKLVADYQERQGKNSPRTLLAQQNLGTVLLKNGKIAEAEAVMRENLDVRMESAPDDWQTFMTKGTLGALLLKKKEFAEAEVLLKSCLEGLQAHATNIPAESRPVRISQAKRWLSELYRATDRAQEADNLSPPNASPDEQPTQ